MVIGEHLSRRPQDVDSLLSTDAMFRSERVLRADAVRPDRRLQFDAVARYLQDIGHDHLVAAGFDDIHPHWIARRTVIDIYKSGHWPENISLHRWASKIGSRWCAVRVDADGSKGTRVETEAFWINFNIATGTPSRLSEEFIARFGAAADPDVLRWKPWLGTEPHPDSISIPFALRATDLDLIDHVNNASYWAALEECLSRHSDLRNRDSLRGVIEHNSPLELADEPTLLAYRQDDTLYAWLMAAGGRNAAAMVAAAID